MFTSGSTGKPKGVMIEHRGIVRLARQSYSISLKAGTKFSHLANLAFDASTWEIYTSILNGGTLICLDFMTVIDTAQLTNRFIQEQIQVAKFTPALLKQSLESPAMFRSLEMLFSAGDRLHPHLARHAMEHTTCRIFNAYGPTENTGFSTCFEITRGEDTLMNTIPIGNAIDNSGAIIMDSELRMVPAGVIGELVVTGDGLGRGYLDPRHEKDRFIDISIEGKNTRAYRTGDYARCRPVDGAIEFHGRVDHQVKIRGHRVELGEVERALLDTGLVNDAVAVMQNGDGNADAKLLGFVTLLSDSGPQNQLTQRNGAEEGEEVTAWAEIRKAVIYADVGTIDPSQLGRDFMGWKSMYDGEDIPKHEMDEWLQDTMTTFLNGQAAGHVLEIGTGTGMILFNLGQGLKSYFGLEPVETVANFVSSMAKSIPQLADRVKIQVGTASEVSSLKGIISPTAVVVNSVAQYFPSPDYLQDLVEGLLQLQSVEYLFFGDMRSYALYEQFQVSMATHHFGTRPNKEQLRRYMEQMKQDEKELLVDPAFFTALKDKYPQVVRHVEILPKRMKARNELSCYRYAAVVYTKRFQDTSLQIHNVEEETWVDFLKQKMNGASLLAYLQDNASSAIVAVSNIPHMTSPEQSVLETLHRSAETNGEWTSLLDTATAGSQSFSAVDLAEIAAKAGFEVEISWARQFTQCGGLDAVFHHIPKSESRRTLFEFPTDHEGRDFGSLINRPLQFRLNRTIEKTLRDSLQAKLPSYMVPWAIKIIDEMPLNQNKKVDRQALALMSVTGMPIAAQSTNYIEPRNDIERALCEEFAATLGADVGVMDSFFDLGGHSLMATRVVSRINKRMNTKVSVFDFYQFPTPAALCELITTETSAGVEKSLPGYLHHHARLGSKATIVLIHGFWGQGSIFLPLLSLLDDHFDVILVQDPFFGKPDGPKTIAEWAKFYLQDIRKAIRHYLPVILGGYSLGGLIAFEMASAWREVFGSEPLSILLLDAGSRPTLAEFFAEDAMPEETIDQALAIFGADQRPMVCQHFDKLRRLSIDETEQRNHNGDCLYLPTPRARESATSDWWDAHCPQLDRQVLNCGHDDVLGPLMVQTVAKLINDHYCRLINPRSDYESVIATGK